VGDDVDRAATTIDETGAARRPVNCAGISPSMTRSEDLSVDEWQDVLDVNLTGTFRCSQAASRLMDSGTGSIVNVSSIHGSVGMPRLAAYSASKGAVDALTRTLAVEWAGRGIRVNAVCPGYFSTDMTAGLRHSETWSDRITDRVPQGRFGSRASGARRSSSPAAGPYITGTCMVVDGVVGPMTPRNDLAYMVAPCGLPHHENPPLDLRASPFRFSSAEGPHG
jgi:NAD(P)-dependent dehydrogenase (short-subunit alcohol dehydrogenase family)